MMRRISVRTSDRVQMIDITDRVRTAVTEAGLRDGICLVFVPHTTAGVTINENADPSVVRDVLTALSALVPASGCYTHSEGNSDAHIKASMMGFSVELIVENGELQLGTWQGVYFCEFDGPRSRQVWVRTVNSDQ
ncbi:MAG: secondary thiamine-phosphate synthase enzyme YjbQ [Armatimonadota bacterium]|nr:secondary thiamine-phosphate synthase enzyme YjbQ [Armatimonadota bacterium]